MLSMPPTQKNLSIWLHKQGTANEVTLRFSTNTMWYVMAFLLVTSDIGSVSWWMKKAFSYHGECSCNDYTTSLYYISVNI